MDMVNLPDKRYSLSWYNWQYYLYWNYFKM